MVGCLLKPAPKEDGVLPRRGRGEGSERCVLRMRERTNVQCSGREGGEREFSERERRGRESVLKGIGAAGWRK